jgi:hypothetical protein
VVLFGGHPAREVAVDAVLVGERVDAVQALRRALRVAGGRSAGDGGGRLTRRDSSNLPIAAFLRELSRARESRAWLYGQADATNAA